MASNAVEVLITVKEEDELFLQCIKSLKESNDDIKITISSFDSSGVGNARINAFNNSSEEYICFIDPDDYVIGNPFKKAISFLNAGYSAYYSNHFNVENNKIMRKWFNRVHQSRALSQVQMHHVVVYKRSIIAEVIPLLKDVITKDKELLNLKSLTEGIVMGDEEVHYGWRMDGHGNHKNHNFKNNPKLWHYEVSRLKNLLKAQDELKII